MPLATSTRTIEVRRAKRFCGQPGIYKVSWRDRKRRAVLVAVDDWPTADATVADAVANTYPLDDRPRVTVPMGAWR